MKLIPHTTYHIQNTNKRFPLLLGLMALIILLPLAIYLARSAHPAAAGWWDSTSGGGSWLKRQNVPVVNNSGDNLASGTTVAITLDTKTLVSQGKLQSDCDDLRVVHQSSSDTELTRYLSYPGGGTCATSEATKVYFKLNAALTNGSTDTDYYIYYGNPAAAGPSSTVDAFDVGSANALLVCPFDGTTECINGDGPEDPTTESGAIRYSGAKSAAQFNGQNSTLISSSGGVEGLNAFTVEMWLNTDYWDVSTTEPRIFESIGEGIYNIRNTSGDSIQADVVIGEDSYYFQTTITADGQWHHAALQYDGFNLSWYIDGVLDNQTPASGAVGGSSPTGITIATQNSAGDYSGLVDEFRLSTIARYSSNFTPTTSPFIRDEHTQILYHFDENGDDPRNTGTAFDDSGNGNHGTTSNVKYVSGIVGIDGHDPSVATGRLDSQSYGGRGGILMEEGTTNKITNPSFEHSTYNTHWDAVGTNLTASENTTAPFYKFGSKSLKLVANASAISGTSNMDTIGIDPNSTNVHTLSFYAYDGTSGNVGGTVSSSIVKPVWEGTAQSGGTYTDMGGGWWRVSYYATATDSTNEYGVEVQVDKTVYIDAVQLEDKSYAGTGRMTSFTDGSLGTNYAWTGTANESTSTRTETIIRHSSTSNIQASTGTISFWIKFPYYRRGTPYVVGWGTGCGTSYGLMIGPLATGNFNLLLTTPTILEINNVSSSYGKWNQIAITYDSSGRDIYVNGVSVVDDSVTTGITDITSNLYIGDRPCSANYSDLMGGILSDLRTYDDALTPTEMADLYYSGLVSHSDTYEVDAFSEDKGQNPVGIYHFDESYGTTANDASTYANHLTVSGATWNTQSVGGRSKLERNLSFDGTDDYLSRKFEREFDFGTGSFSISGWFRHPDTISGTDTILSKVSAVDGVGFKVYMNSSGNMCFGIDDTASSFPADSACTTTDLSDNLWHQVEVVKNGTTSLTVYIDGNEAGSDMSITSTGSLNTSNSLYVGIDADGSSNHWNGYLDEIIIYPYARSAAQVKTDFAGGQISASYGSLGGDPLSEGLVGYWPLEVTVSSLIETQAATNDGDPASATFSDTPDEGNLLVAIAFERGGTSETNFTISGSGWTKRVARDTLLTDSNARRTLVIWTKTAGASEPTNVQVDNGTTNSKALLIREFDANGGTWTFEDKADNDSGTGSTSPLSTGTISDISSNSVLTITAASWRNQTGAPGSIAWTNNISDTSEILGDTSGRAINTGYTIGSGGTKESSVSWTGTGHEASAAILVFSNPNLPPSTTPDSSGNLFTLSSNGHADFPGGKFGNGSEHVPASTQYFSSASTINGIKTVSFWTNPDSTTNYYASLTSGAYITSSGGTLSATGFTNPKIYVNGVASTAVVADQWQLVTVTSDTVVNADQFYIGRQGSNYYDGTLDDVRMYNRALSPAEVQDLYEWAPGPVGYWKMDENQGSYAYDASGNGNTGTFSNNPLWISGKFGSAVDLQGTTCGGSAINAGSNSVLDNVFDSGGTITAWINPRDDAFGDIASKGETATNGWYYQVDPTNDIRFNYQFDGTDGSWQTATDFVPNQWNHVAITYNSSSTSNVPVFYLNGIVTTQGSSTTPVGTRVSDDSNNIILGNRNNSCNPLNGQIDDVKIYNYARTPAQIIEDMNAGHPAPGSPVGSAYIHYQFNEGFGTTASNSGNGGSSLDGTITSGTWTNSGKFGKALTFSASTEVTDTITDPGYTNTLSLWVYPTTSAASKTLVTSGKLTTDTSSRPVYGGCIGTALSLNTWVHLVAVSDGSGSCVLYQDGKLTSSGTTGVTFGTSLQIGDTSFTGTIDEFKLYNLAMTADQVKVEYNQGASSVWGSLSTNSTGTGSFSSTDSYCPPASGAEASQCVGPVAEWQFDENTGTTANDTSGNNNTGTLTNGPEWKSAASCKHGACLSFDGTNDYLTIPYTAALDHTSNFTVSFWWSPQTTWDTNSSTLDTGLLGRSTSGYVDYDSDWAFFLFGSGNYTSDDDGRMRFGTYGNNIQTNTATWTAGQWYHIALAFTDSNNATIYVNGRPDNYNSDYAAGTIDGNENNPLELGRITYAVGAASYTNYFPQKIDNLRIYDYVRTPAQIAWDYNQGAPLAHWKLDENQTGDGQTVYDASGNGNNGTTEGGTGNLDCTVTGKRNTACDFDGGDDYIYLDDNNNFSFTDGSGNDRPFTTSAWIKTTQAGRRILSKYDIGSGIEYQFWLETNFLKLELEGNGDLQAVSTDSIITGNWTHVAATYDGSEQASGIKLYINGKQASSTNSEGGTYTGMSNTSANICIGCRFNTFPTPVNVFDGPIDDVKIFNYVLTAEQVKLEYGQGAVQFGP